MTEKLSNRGFETGDLSSWTVVESSGIYPYVTTLDPRTGTYVVHMTSFATVGFGGSFSRKSTRLRQAVTVESGSALAASVWVKNLNAIAANYTAELWVDDGSGSEILRDSIDLGVIGPGVGYVELSWSGTSTGTTASLSVRCTNTDDGVPTSSAYVALDDCSLTEVTADMAILKSIRDAAVLDLTGLTVRSGVTIQDVFTVPKLLDDIERFPCIFIAPGDGGNSELETISNLYGRATQELLFVYVDSTEDPNDDLDNATDAIRNALEASGGNLLNLESVVTAVVQGFSPVIPTDGETSERKYWREITVVVDYIYTRGSA